MRVGQKEKDIARKKRVYQKGKGQAQAIRKSFQSVSRRSQKDINPRNSRDQRNQKEVKIKKKSQHHKNLENGFAVLGRETFNAKPGLK